MANIKENLNNIKNALFGKDVRQSIHDAIEQCYNDASVNGNANMEVEMARGTYDTLGKRLDNSEEKISVLNTGLDSKASESDLQVERDRITEVANKGTTVEVLTSVTQTEINKKIESGEMANLTIGNETITDDKLNFISNKFIVSNIDNVYFKTNGDKSISIEIINNTSNLTHWCYNREGSTYLTLNETVKNKTYLVPLWGRLIWNCETNTIEINDGSKLMPNKYFLLALNNNGFVADGYFTKIKNQVYTSELNKIQVYLDNPNSLYCFVPNFDFTHLDPNSDNIYFKFEGNIIINGKYGVNKVYEVFKWQDIYNILDDKDQSPELVKDCLVLRRNKKLVYNLLTKTFVFTDVGTDDNVFNIVLLENNSSCMGGKLKDINDNNNFRKLKTHKNGIEDFFKNHIKAKENQVISHMGEDTVNFIFTSDNHVQEHIGGYTMKSHVIMNDIFNTLNIKRIINGGDSILYGDEDVAKGYDALKIAVSKFKYKDKYLYARGNHDCGGNLSDGVTKKYLINNLTQYNITQKHLDNLVVWGSKEYGYYYQDLENEKIRIIVLNTSDIPWINNELDSSKLEYDVLSSTNISQKQLDWLYNKALYFEDKDNKTEWHTLIICHAPILTQDEGMTGNNLMGNKALIQKTIEGFANGTRVTGVGNGDFTATIDYDFSSRGAMPLIGLYSGHIHADRLINLNNVNHISIMADYPESKWLDEQPSRSNNTTNSICFDVLTINKKLRSVYLTRFGAGDNRQYNY